MKYLITYVVVLGVGGNIMKYLTTYLVNYFDSIRASETSGGFGHCAELEPVVPPRRTLVEPT